METTLGEVSRRDKLGLIAEWMDPHASLLKRFYFFFYPYDSTIELYEIKKNRLFLKRTRVNNLNFGDIYVGNVVTIFSRQLKLVDYANIITKQLLQVKMMKTFALIKPDAIENKAKIFQMLTANGFRISNLRMLKLADSLVNRIAGDEENSSQQDLKSHLQSGPSIALELIGENGIEKLIKLAGPKDPVIAKNEEPGSIVALFGKDEVHNAFYCSPTLEHVDKEVYSFFEDRSVLRDVKMHTARLEDSSTCCVIKPHILKEGNFGEIVEAIENAGFNITAMQMFYIDNGNAEEFYEIYKGVLVEFNDMVEELISGGCIAMEITGPHGKDTPSRFRTFAGPSDPDIARKLRPNTLRARFGIDKIKNGVHASDLPHDGVLEVGIPCYLFL